MTLELYLQFWAKILSIWWPVFFSALVGLAYLSYTERRDKHKKRTRKPASKIGP